MSRPKLYIVHNFHGYRQGPVGAYTLLDSAKKSVNSPGKWDCTVRPDGHCTEVYISPCGFFGITSVPFFTPRWIK